MRRILLLTHKAPVSGAFSLNDLAGGGGRMDEIARCVSTAFLVSHGLRKDLELTILFSQAPPPAARRIRVVGERIRHLNPDERSTAALLKNALVRSIPLEREVEASPGIFVAPADPRAELERFLDGPGRFWLTEDAPRVLPEEIPSESYAILGDSEDPLPEERAILEARSVPRRSLGPVSLRASQCLDLWNHLLDVGPSGPSGAVRGD